MLVSWLATEGLTSNVGRDAGFCFKIFGEEKVQLGYEFLHSALYE